MTRSVQGVATKRGDVRDWETKGTLKVGETDLPSHAALIKRQVDRSLEDKETIQLARKIVSGRADKHDKRKSYVIAWGEHYELPPRPELPELMGDHAAMCEVMSIWNFWVTNVAYLEDPPDVDQFATVRYSLERRGGDCGWSTVGLSALLKAVGFRNLRARIVSTDGEFYEHVYAMVGVPKTRSTRLIALDPTVKGATPGWEFSRSRMVQDFIL